jgi:hypothetical protein
MDGNEQAPSASDLRDIEAVADAAAAAKPNALQRLLISAGLLHPTQFQVPILSKSDQMMLDLRRQLGPPQPWVQKPMLPRSYAVPGVPPSAMPVVDDGWGKIQELDAQRQAITDQLGDFSQRVLSNKAIMGDK